jgi:cytochrome c peroxidase
MRTLRPPPRPISWTPAALHGRDLFTTAGCATCHPAPLYTDRKKHDVGTGTSPLEQKGTSFDTPSLRDVALTPPYFHDGSAATLPDVVRTHGAGPTLTDSERGDLVEFLRTISFTSARRRAAGR